MNLFAADLEVDQDAARGSASDPTPDQIRTRAAAVRQRWSDAQRKRRLVPLVTAWLPPLVHVADVAANISQSN
ncbi:hypothetical protein [Rubripirellula reticaptiva]|uniref:Uncharacterized protein n=1 Tax=Rubripirellula reticaptiva TaxID=2528013 RepID=A0A5C6F3C2_9BACT|nr:hypothetical protein [Rubripirellula reticaptiva]TWU55828.1 hypothetical protein Poly59_21310 [Rubripirellula reticaptiva]